MSDHTNADAVPDREQQGKPVADLSAASDGGASTATEAAPAAAATAEPAEVAVRASIAPSSEAPVVTDAPSPFDVRGVEAPRADAAVEALPAAQAAVEAPPSTAVPTAQAAVEAPPSTAVPPLSTTVSPPSTSAPLVEAPPPSTPAEPPPRAVAARGSFSAEPSVTGAVPVVPSEIAVAPPSKSTRKERKKKPPRVKPRIQWRSFSGYFALLWLVDLGWVVRLLTEGVGVVTQFPTVFVAKIAGGLFGAFLLAFIVPIAMLDDSSHNPRAWWVAWLWPPVMVLMLATDILVMGYAAGKLYPLVELLKKH